jgi:NTE family protein
LRLHRIAAEQAAESIEQAGTLDLDWGFLSRLRDSGYEAADEWLAGCFRQPAAAGIRVLR